MAVELDEVLRNRAVALLQDYYERPRCLTIRDLLRCLPPATVGRILQKPYFGALMATGNESLVLEDWIFALSCDKTLFPDDLQAIEGVRARLAQNIWKQDFGDISYNPRLIREALDRAADLADSVPPAGPGTMIVEDVP
jgi:hypothetical protein